MVVRDDLSVKLPEEVVEEMGLRAGSEVELKRQPGGESPKGPGSRLYGLLVPHLKVTGGGVEAFLEWRREDARLDGSL